MLRSKFLLLYLNNLDLNAEMITRLENKFGTAFMTWMRVRNVPNGSPRQSGSLVSRVYRFLDSEILI
jgi:hypothetical protein